jgi:hypothetical protein
VFGEISPDDGLRVSDRAEDADTQSRHLGEEVLYDIAPGGPRSGRKSRVQSELRDSQADILGCLWVA